MDKSLHIEIETLLKNSPTKEQVIVTLENKGYQASDVEEALESFKDSVPGSKEPEVKQNKRLFVSKEVLDRVGYGFGTQSFVNILFYQTIVGAGLGQFAFLIIGIINGLKSIISSRISSLTQAFASVGSVSKRWLSAGGILFGFSFLFMALGRSQYSVPLFAISLLLGSIGVVAYGDLYNRLLRDTLKKERMGNFLAKISQYGLIITAITLLFGAWLMEVLPVTGTSVNIAGKSFVLYGYLIAFEITALVFIISGYILSLVKEKKRTDALSFKEFYGEYKNKKKKQLKVLFSNKFAILLVITSVIIGLAQALGNSFYGIFIYESYKNLAFGGFLNVGIIYAVAVLVSMAGPWLSRKLNKSIGYSPMLVFGTLLIALMPAAAAWNPNLYAVGLANTLSIVGAATLGFAQGLLARKVLKSEEREMFYANSAALMTIPFIIFIPLGAWLAHQFGLALLFKAIVALLVFAALLFVVLVAFANKKKL